MELGSILHRSAFSDCYALNENEIVVTLRTGKDVTSVTIVHADPFADGCMGHKPWHGEPEAMRPKWELAHHIIWSVTLAPPDKREQYYFLLSDGEETLVLLENGFYTPEQAAKPGRLMQYFKFPWLNVADVASPPDWVGDTVWYQIMPDRFCRSGEHECRFSRKDWYDTAVVGPADIYGGDLKGITSRLEYLKELGITGIYTTPIFLSDTNHRYNTFTYDCIDPDLGTEEDMKALVEKAHSLGIRVMVDAVFNHCGIQFVPWQDVLQNGPDSPYWDWFFVNEWPLPDHLGGTEDGRYYSFAYVAYMPKLNTNNPAVAEYCLQRCLHWVEDWKIDGIRFDVGNETSHQFLKTLNRGLKAAKPDLFLLGEIWHDSIQWLQGDEYDSVMNYPFLHSLHDFYLDGTSSRALMYDMNRIYTMYPAQVSNVLFNFLDTHDTARALNRCGSEDVFFQQLAFLLAMPGSACIYYGTEIALPGADDPDNRRPMPWSMVERGEKREIWEAASRLINIRKEYPQLRRGEMGWHHGEDTPRYVCIDRTLEGEAAVLTLCLNAGETAVDLPAGKLLFGRKTEGERLLPGGCAIVCK